jgi:hypothetical protein
MSISSVVNDLVTSVSVINAQKPIPPTISGYSVGGVDDTALDPAGGQTVQINGTGFLVGATITFDGSAVAVVTYVNPNQLTFTSPAKSAGTYTIYVVNSDGGTAIYIPGIIYSVLPTWTTSAGTLGSYYETTSISNTVVASGDAPITYSLFSGSLPTGSTLYANGVITGTAPVDSSSTTYSFTIEAIDAQLQGSTRSFSLTINVDAVTWVSPANNTTYTSAVDSAISNVALSATDAAGYSVSYSANSLPTGLTLTGSNIAGTPTVIADSSTLLTATAATTNRTAVRTINWSITVAGDPFFEYNTLLIPGASTTFVADASTNNFAITIAGDTKPNSFNPYTPGYYSNYFDGSGDYLTAPAGANSFPGDFTFEFWLYPTTDGYSAISGDTNNSYLFQRENGAIGVYMSGTDFPIGTGAAPTNTWTHIAWVRNGTTSTLYINGVNNASRTLSGTLGSATTMYFGARGDLTGYTTGYLSNIRIVKGTAVYTSAFTPSTTPLTAIANTSLLTCQSNRFIDNSTNNFTITVVGNTSITSFQPFTPNSSYSTYGSGYFDGTGDYLTVPYNSALNLGSDTTWTMEYWVYFNAAFGTYTPISFVQSSLLRWNMEHAASTTLLLFNNSTAVTFTNPSTLTPSNWYHIAWVRNGTTVRMYINGVASSTTSTNNLQTISSGPLSIGYNALGGYEFYMNGYISNVRLVKGVAVYTGAFTPPTSPLQATQSAGTNIAAITGTSTSLLTLQTNQPVNNNIFLDNSTNNFLVTRNGNTTQGTFSPYGGNWSNYFGGQMASALSPSSTKFNLTGDFTLEAYVFLTALPGGDWGILDARVSGASASPWLYSIGGNGKLTFYDGSVKNGATTVTLNTWHHVAWVRNGSVLRGYLDGVLDYYNGAYGSGAVSPGSTAPVVGTKDYGISAAWGTTGYISNLRVVNGTAVYTTSSTTVGATIFTPSTTPLTAVTNTVVLTCQSQRFVDNSLNNFTVTPSSTTISVQRFSPFNPSSLTPTSYSGYFDGTGDYLNVASNAAFNLSSGDWTIEGWFYFNALVTGSTLFAIQPTSGSTYSVYLNGTSGQIDISLVGSSTITMAASGSIAVGSWYHIAFVKTSTSTITCYVNGVTKNNTTSYTFSNSNSSFYIGENPIYSGVMSNGYISNFRVVKGVAVYTGTFTVPTSPLQATQSSGTNIAAITGTSTSLLTCQSTSFIDNSTNNFTITANGNSQPTIQNPFGYTSATTQGYTVSTIGGSGYFDGNADYLSVPSSSAAALGTTYTIECYIYRTGTASSGSYTSVMQLINTQPYGSSVTGFMLTFDGGNVFNFRDSSSAVIVSTADTNLPLNTWIHVAIVRNGSGSNNVTMYLNGVSIVTGTSSGTQATNQAMYIGGDSNGNCSFPGYISNLRIVKGTAVYKSNFVPSSAPLTAIQNTVLLTNMTGAGIYDAAMMTTMETVADAKLSTAVSKFGGSSMSFDGTGDYLTSPFNPSFNLGAGNFTIEFWVNTTSTVAYATALRLGDTWTTGSWALYLNDSNGNGYPSWWAQVPYTLSTSGASINDGSWHHIALVRNGSSFVMYIDGTSRGTLTNSASVGDTTTKLWIGRDSSNVREWAGYIDDLRITKGYARYTSNFTPPTTAFPIY